MQQEMFPTTTQSFVIAATHDLDGGWHLKVCARREGTSFDANGGWTHYDRLTTAELINLVMDVLPSIL